MVIFSDTNLVMVDQEPRAMFCALLCIHLKQLSLHFFNIFLIPDALEGLHVYFQLIIRSAAISKRNEQFFSLGSNVAYIPDDEELKFMSFFHRMAARINLIANVLPVPPGSTKIFPIIDRSHYLIVNFFFLKHQLRNDGLHIRKKITRAIIFSTTQFFIERRSY